MVTIEVKQEEKEEEDVANCCFHSKGAYVVMDSIVFYHYISDVFSDSNMLSLSRSFNSKITCSTVMKYGSCIFYYKI